MSNFHRGDCHFILGGVRSGKSRRAQALAEQAEREGFRVCVLATALAADEDMRARIARHRAERPGHWRTIEVPCTAEGLADAVAEHAAGNTCLLIDCLTVWLSQLLFPPPGRAPLSPEVAANACESTLQALAQAPGRIVVVSNEVGLGVMPIDAGTRQVVDALGRLHQRVAAQADRVTWMLAGVPMEVKPR
jgi:adenosylcobinamide kinase / adenosylcobinamide-phosphate guanylyltransferase